MPAIDNSGGKTGLERLHALRSRLQMAVVEMDASVLAQKKKLDACDFYLEHGGYDSQELVKERAQIVQNLAVLEVAAASERARLADCEAQVVGEERILVLHHPQHVCNVRGFHTWVVTTIFDSGLHRGEWRRRHCSVCATTEMLGHES